MKVDVIAWSAGEQLHALFGLSADEISVGAEELCARLLDQRHVQLTTVGLRECQLFVARAGKAIVDENGLPQAIVTKTD